MSDGDRRALALILCGHAACVAIVSVFLLLAPQKADAQAPASPRTFDGSRAVVIDGDTLDLPCPRGGLRCRRERVRILNIDAPETKRGACAAEQTLGLRARERLAALIAGRTVTLLPCEESGRCRDRFGRLLARLVTDQGDVGWLMIRSGHALPWAPGAQAKSMRKAQWCGRRA